MRRRQVRPLTGSWRELTLPGQEPGHPDNVATTTTTNNTTTNDNYNDNRKS